MRSLSRRRTGAFPYLLVLPAVLAILSITFYPIGYSLIISFFDVSFTRAGMDFVGFENYGDVLTEGQFVDSILFTYLWTAINLALMSLLSITAALLLRGQIVGNKLLKTTLLVPWIIPQVVTGFVWSLMLSQGMGIINHILISVGLVPDDFSWFQTGRTALIAIVMANSWRGFPFMALMLYAKLATIPAEQLEAARVDGATPLQQFRYVMVPYVKQVYLTCLLLVFVWTFNAFDIIRVMTNGGPIRKTTTIALLVHKEAFEYFEISRASSMSIMMFMLILAVLGIVFLIRRLLSRRSINA